jgi:glycine betaine/proline transport system substrate-binding protein
MRRVATTAVAVATLFAAACTSDLSINNGAPETTTPPSTTVVATTTAPTTTSTTTPPPDRGPVRIVRANWDVGLVHSSLVMEVLAELGFEPIDVGADDHNEGLSPDLSYPVLASGDVDLYANAWLPDHFTWFEAEDAGFSGTAGDHLSVVSTIVPAGGLQGWLITKAWADAEGISSLDQIAETPSLALALDHDGNGRGEIYGCPEDWTCDDVIRGYIWFNEWDEVLEQVIEPERELQGLDARRGQSLYDAMFEEFLERVERDEPAVAYVWTPTTYHSLADVGDTTLWLSLSNDAVRTGARYQFEPDPRPGIVRADGTIGFTDLPTDRCTQGPDGCQTGWYASDISIVGSRLWIDEHPEAVAVLDAIEIDRREASDLIAELQALRLTEWDDKVAASHTIARAWMDANPERVAAWLDAR